MPPDHRQIAAPAAFFLALLTALSCLGMPNGIATTGIGDLPLYPGARLLCDEHVSSGSGHISWKSAATDSEAAEIVGFYEKNLAIKATATAGVYTLQASDNPDLKVTVAPITHAGELPSCGKTAPAAAKSLIVISQMLRIKSGH